MRDAKPCHSPMKHVMSLSVYTSDDFSNSTFYHSIFKWLQYATLKGTIDRDLLL